MTKWREEGRELEIKNVITGFQEDVYSGTHPLFLFLVRYNKEIITGF